MSRKIQDKTIVKRKEKTAFMTKKRQTHVKQPDCGICLESMYTPRGPPARRHSSPAQQPSARPEVLTENKEENGTTVMCLASLHVTLGPAMMAALRHPARGSPARGRQRRARCNRSAMRRFLRSAFRGEQPLPPRRATCPAQAVPSGESNLPGQWRRRRNSLVLLKKHQKNMHTK